MTLSSLDKLILACYLVLVIGIGFIAKRKASKGLESYFLGNRTLPWWMLAMSGSSSYFDITGTMWIVSILVQCGYRGMWIQWMWGFIIAAFYMAFMGKWIRRSGVMTGAEWMILRFGKGRDGQLSRLSYTLYAILTLSAFMGYTAVGMGKFGSQFLPYSDHTCAMLIIGITGIYVVLGGFRGLTIVEFFQTIILTAGAVMIAYLGYQAYDQGLAVSPPDDWFSILPVWKLERSVPESSPFYVPVDSMYYCFGAIVITYVAKGLLLCFSGPEQLYDFQKFLAVKTPREASLMGMLWGVFHAVRFPMAMAVAILGLSSLAGDTELLTLVKNDPEKVMPVVIAHTLPVGLVGFALAALISAFMGAFSAMVNGGASYLVRDVYQNYLRPQASTKELIYASYAASILLIVVGLIISQNASSINTLFTWIMATLGAGVLMPNVLRWYWWRLNGWGYFAGTAAGMGLSLVQVILEQFEVISAPVYVTFPVMLLGVFIICVVVTCLTPPTDPETLRRFYRMVQPAGWWQPVAEQINHDDKLPKDDFSQDLLALVLAIPWLAVLYVAPMYLITHHYSRFLVGMVLFGALSVGLWFTWWRKLPSAQVAEQERGGMEL
jgi:Na+/proline symporter